MSVPLLLLYDINIVLLLCILRPLLNRNVDLIFR
jgi:hypothetical protein